MAPLALQAQQQRRQLNPQNGASNAEFWIVNAVLPQTPLKPAFHYGGHNHSYYVYKLKFCYFSTTQVHFASKTRL